MLMREALDTSTHGGQAYSADFDDDLIDEYVMDDWMRTSLDKDDVPLTDGSCSPSPPSNDVMPLDGELRCCLQDMNEDNALSHSNIASEPAGVPFVQHIARKQSPSKVCFQQPPYVLQFALGCWVCAVHCIMPLKKLQVQFDVPNLHKMLFIGLFIIGTLVNMIS